MFLELEGSRLDAEWRGRVSRVLVPEIGVVCLLLLTETVLKCCWGWMKRNFWTERVACTFRVHSLPFQRALGGRGRYYYRLPPNIRVAWSLSCFRLTLGPAQQGPVRWILLDLHTACDTRLVVCCRFPGWPSLRKTGSWWNLDSGRNYGLTRRASSRLLTCWSRIKDIVVDY